MNFRAFNEIIQLNKDFYAKIGQEFDKTRQSAWPGWEKVLEVLRGSGQLKGLVHVADLGCGNGRFLKFLIENNFDDIDYFGYDSDDYLLDLPQIHYDVGFYRFQKMDILSDIKKISDKFEVVVAFGLVHHIPSYEYRLQWFSEVASLLKPNGIFVFTTWNYNRDERFKPQNEKFPDLKNELEENDYIIGWNNSDAYRYVHIYSDDEITQIIKATGLKLITKFSADGKNNNLNDYFILQKIEI